MNRVTSFLSGLCEGLAQSLGGPNFADQMQCLQRDTGLALTDLDEDSAIFALKADGRPYRLHVVQRGANAKLMVTGPYHFRPGCLPAELVASVRAYSRDLPQCDIVPCDGAKLAFFGVITNVRLGDLDAPTFLAAAKLLLPAAMAVDRTLEQQGHV